MKPETVTEENVVPAVEAPKEEAPAVEAAPAAEISKEEAPATEVSNCLLYTSPSPRDRQKSRMPSSA